MSDAGGQLSGAGCRIRMSTTGYRLLDVGCWISDVSSPNFTFRLPDSGTADGWEKCPVPTGILRVKAQNENCRIWKEVIDFFPGIAARFTLNKQNLSAKSQRTFRDFLFFFLFHRIFLRIFFHNFLLFYLFFLKNLIFKIL